MASNVLHQFHTLCCVMCIFKSILECSYQFCFASCNKKMPPAPIPCSSDRIGIKLRLAHKLSSQFLLRKLDFRRAKKPQKTERSAQGSIPEPELKSKELFRKSRIKLYVVGSNKFEI